ncbi:MAG: FAD-dependent thymidylate synthase [Psychrobacillus sp.]
MKFHLYKVSGYEEAIMSLRMSKGKYFSIPKAEEIQTLVWLVTDRKGLISNEKEYRYKVASIVDRNGYTGLKKITGDYKQDVAEFKRLLQLTFDNAMGTHKHHTLMKYIDISFFTEGLHRGAQDDLDAHAIAFNNRITRFSTRLAEIEDVQLSQWYEDKVIPFSDTIFYTMDMSNEIYRGENKYIKTPFGYVLEKYAQVPAKNGLAKDVQRGLMPLGLASDAIWKSDMFNMRYVYKMRSKLTKANPELKEGMEQLADQLEQIPVFGEYFRKELTDSGVWEHMNKVKTVSFDEYQEFKKWKKVQTNE